MGSIFRRGTKRGTNKKGAHGPYWIAWVDHRGKQHAESTRIKGRPGTGYDYNAAVRLLKEREGDVVKGLPVTAATGKLLFTDALKDVITDQEHNERRAVAHTKRRIDLHIAPYFAGLRIAEVTATQIRGFVAERKTEGARPATINRDLAIIRRAFRLAARAGHVLSVPHVEMLDESRNVRQGFFDAESFGRVLKALTPAAYAAAAETAFITGWRLRSEVLTLDWSQVDRRARVLRIDVGRTKAGEGRIFPITKRLRKILEQRAGKGQEYPAAGLVFSEDDSTAITPEHFYARWNAATKAAECPGMIPHDLRRSAVRLMERARVPRQVAMKLVGHRTESIYRRYAIVSESDIRDAGALLDGVRAVSTAKVLRSKGSKRQATGKKRKKTE